MKEMADGRIEGGIGKKGEKRYGNLGKMNVLDFINIFNEQENYQR